MDHVRRQGDSFADGWLRRNRQDEAMGSAQSQPATPVPSEVSQVAPSSGWQLHADPFCAYSLIWVLYPIVSVVFHLQ